MVTGTGVWNPVLKSETVYNIHVKHIVCTSFRSLDIPSSLPHPISYVSSEDTSLVTAIQEGLSLSPHTHTSVSTSRPTSSIQQYLQDAKAHLAIITMHTGKLVQVTRGVITDNEQRDHL